MREQKKTLVKYEKYKKSLYVHGACYRCKIREILA